jgi:hypothetical protein
MIIYELICAAKHRFEGWFASGEDFEQQREHHLVACPSCASTQVDRLPTAKIKKASVPAPQEDNEAADAFLQFVDALYKNSEDVGRGFADEARRIHHEEAPRRNIRGLATTAESATLREEGIEVMNLPVPPRDKMN